MAARVDRIASGIALLLLSLPAAGAPPKSAPPVYLTGNFGLTFQVPNGLTYCPLPADWIGSDHGTILFLRAPRDCGQVGFPSIFRSFQPEDTPRIEIYYGYAGDQEAPCETPAGQSVLLGARHIFCRANRGVMTDLTIRSRFDTAEVSFSLITTAGRLEEDLTLLREILPTVRTCKTDCPAGATWF